MKSLSFAKMHGCGNDFVIINALSQKFQAGGENIRYLASRHFGIGCDQVLILNPPHTETADFHCYIFNSDGSEAEQCGNGMRSLAHYILKNNLAPGPSVRVSTSAGISEIKSKGKEPEQMFEVALPPPKISLVTVPELNDKEIPLIDMGNHHVVLWTEDVKAEPLEELASRLGGHSALPKGVNLSIAQITGENSIQMRVFERGAGETLACGSASCAVMAAAYSQKLVGNRAKLRLPGGTLLVSWAGDDSSIYLCGPSAYVFDGTIYLGNDS